MPEPIAYVLYGHFNGSFMLENADNLIRCSVCQELLERPSSIPGFKLRKKRDVSGTYDGYTIVSRRFFDTWQQSGGAGLLFWPLYNEPDFFVVEAEREVEFDVERRRTCFEEYRPCCGRFHSVAGATPAFLKSPESLPKIEAVRTNVSFGSGDEKSPLIIIPLALGHELMKAKLTGMDLAEVLA